MPEKNLIVELVNLVERKLNWGSRFNWSKSYFEQLSENIYKETGILISPRTLTRLFKSKDPGQHNPQSGTKNGLSMFLGYRNWFDFEANHRSGITKPRDKNQEGKKNSAKMILIAFAAIVILTLAFISIKNLLILRSEKNVEFRCNNTSGDYPFTTTFYYDVSQDIKNLHYNSGEGLVYHKLKQDKNTFRHGYLSPGIFNAKLIGNNKILKNKIIQVKSKGWESIIGYDKTNAKPIAFTNKPIVPKNGIMHIGKNEVFARGVDTTARYWVNYLNTNNFEINADNMTLESGFCNNEKTGGMGCHGLIFTVFGEYNQITVHFNLKGCSYYIENQISEKTMLGKDYDLTKFSQDVRNWGTFKIKTDNNLCLVFYNNEKIIETDYSEKLGNIIGIYYNFHGSGAVDFIEIKDTKTEKEYKNHF
ncbi:MAG: hypothetical protein ACOCWG_06125 [bacterium]